jgi:hypothetical protein
MEISVKVSTPAIVVAANRSDKPFKCAMLDKLTTQEPPGDKRAQETKTLAKPKPIYWLYFSGHPFAERIFIFSDMEKEKYPQLYDSIRNSLIFRKKDRQMADERFKFALQRTPEAIKFLRDGLVKCKEKQEFEMQDVKTAFEIPLFNLMMLVYTIPSYYNLKAQMKTLDRLAELLKSL